MVAFFESSDILRFIQVAEERVPFWSLTTPLITTEKYLDKAMIRCYND